MKETFMCWSEMLPYTVPDWVMAVMQTNYFPTYSGAITSDRGGGGYVAFPSEAAVEGKNKGEILV